MTMSRFNLACFLIFVFGLISSSAQPADVEPQPLRISCGALEDVKSPPTYTLWHKDMGYTGGVIGNATLPSDVTPSLKTLRYFPISQGLTNCYMLHRVPMGKYFVRVFFGLMRLGEEPIFDISVEGTRISSLVQGWSKHDEQVFVEALVFLRNGTAMICFHNVGYGDPAIISLELLQVHDDAYNGGWDSGMVPKTLTRLNFGARKLKFDEDYSGDVWGGNRLWSPIAKKAGASRVSTVHDIMNASTSPDFYPAKLYQSAFVSTDEEPDLTLTMDAEPDKTYSVWFHFAEINGTITREGERVFDVLVNGVTIFRDVDIIRMTGESYTAVVLNSTVTVTGRSLVIVLHPKLGGHALISAIEMFEVIKKESRTSRAEVNALQMMKKDLGVPSRIGWNGDPCVPQEYPWTGVHCQLDKIRSTWLIDALDLHNQGLNGFLTSNISKLNHLHSINLSHNNINGGIPASLGNIKSLEVLDLSYNSFNGSVPESLRELASLRILKFEGNLLQENISSPNDHHTSLRQATIIAASVSLSVIVMIGLVCAVIWWRRGQDLTRAQHQAAGVAPYEKFQLPL